MAKRKNYMIISDLQIPFEAPDAIGFCRAVQREFRVAQNAVLNAGDEVDHYFGSEYKKDPDAIYSPASEISVTIEVLKEWYSTFPTMRLATSNHGMRWAKKAFSAEIPSQMIRKYQEVIGAPKGWKWADEWVIKEGVEEPFRLIHGMGYSGQNGARNAAIDAGMNTVIGHIHSHAGVSHISTGGHSIWSLNTGCLIDKEAFAFQYGKYNRHKPILGCGVVVNGGKTPIFIPYEENLA